jgi:hypothetical protein
MYVKYGMMRNATRIHKLCNKYSVCELNDTNMTSTRTFVVCLENSTEAVFTRTGSAQSALLCSIKTALAAVDVRCISTGSRAGKLRKGKAMTT